MNDCRGGAQRLHSNRLGDFQHLFNGCLKLPTFNKSYTKKKIPVYSNAWKLEWEPTNFYMKNITHFCVQEMVIKKSKMCKNIST